MKILTVCTIALGVLTPVTGVAEKSSSPPGVPLIDQLVVDALQRNHEVRAAQLRAESAEQQPTIAGSLPDPMFTFGYFFQNVETRVGAQARKVAISQKFPYPGKRAAERKRASEEAMVWEWKYESVRRQVVARVKTLYFNLYQIDRSVAVLRQQQTLLDQIEATVRASYEAGKGALPDVLRVQVAQDDVRSRLLQLQQQRVSAVSSLNQLRDEPPETAIPAVVDAGVVPLPKEENLYVVADARRQDLRAAEAAISRDRTALALARKERLPDFTVGLDYTQVNRNIFNNPPDNGQDAVMGFVSINLPIWRDRLRASEEAARKQLDASREAAAEARTAVRAQVRASWFEAKTARDQVDLYQKSLLPRARSALDASRAGYSSGRSGLLDLLDSERSLLGLELGLVMNESNYGKALSALEQAVGVDLASVNQAYQQVEDSGHEN